MIEVDRAERAAGAAVGAAPGTAAVEVAAAGGRSVVRRAFATSPVRLLTPANHGRAAWVYVSGFGGGLVDGDRTEMTIEVGRGAAAFVSTQASTKVYRSPRGTAAATAARVAEGGLLVLAPDPIVCFAGSTYRQSQMVDLDRGAALVLVDWMTSGRHGAGERWAFDEYANRLAVRVAGRLAVYDALTLRAAEADLPGQHGRFNVLAAVVVAGERLREDAARALARVDAQEVTLRAGLLLAGAEAGEHAWVFRVAGRAAEPVGHAIRALLEFVPAILGDDPWSRKW